MNPRTNHTHSIALASKFAVLAAFALLFSGCQAINDYAYAPPPLKPAVWNSSPGFTADSMSKIAIIVESNNQGRYPGVYTTIEDIFMQGAFKKGYRVSDRSDVDKVLQEIRFQQSGLTEGDAARLGQMLNVPAVLLVKIPNAYTTAHPVGLPINGSYEYNYTSSAEMSARLIGVESAEVLGLSTYYSTRSTDAPNNPAPAMVFAAERIADAFPARNSP